MRKSNKGRPLQKMPGGRLAEFGVEVHGAYEHGANVPNIDRVVRYVDTVELLHRRGEIDERQRQAAESFRFLTEAIKDSAFDPERPAGRGVPGSPPLTRLAIAEKLIAAESVIGPVNTQIVKLIIAGDIVDGAGRCYNVSTCASLLFAVPRPSRKQRDEISRRFKKSLTDLADLWFPEGVGSERKGIRSDIVEDGRSGVTDVREIAPSTNRVAHVSKGKVHWSDV